MLRTITILLLLLVCTSSAQAQTADTVLLDLEYRYFLSEDDHERNAILLDKIDYHLDQPNISEQIYTDIKRVKPKLLSEADQTTFNWNASLIYYVSNNHYQAVHYINDFEKSSKDNLDMSFQLLKYLIYAEYDTSISNVLLEDLLSVDTTFTCLSCVSEVANFELKHKNMRILASYFIPGIGTMVTGKPVKGILSLGLNIASAFAIAYTVKNQLWINTFGWGMNLVGKFYTGNIRLATKVIEEKEQSKKKELAHTCELQIRKVFKRYPLNFR